MIYKDEVIKEIETVLGRPFDPKTVTPYESLNQIPVSLIKEARTLPERLWFRYLDCFVPESDSMSYKLFYQQVVEEGRDPEWWMVATHFAPKFSPDLLQDDNLDDVADYRSVGNEDWYFYPLVTSDWETGQHRSGAPVVANLADKSRSYRWYPPENIVAYRNGKPSVNTSGYQKHDSDVRVLLRRWFASVIARKAAECKYKGVNRRPVDDISELYHHVKAFFQTSREPNKVISELFPEVQNPSEDALLAIEGLLLEIADGDYGNNQIPGYVGPDTFYSKTAPKQTIPTAEQFPVEAPSLDGRIISIDQARTKASELLIVPKETFADSAQDFPDIEAYYLWENVRGGRALVVGYDGTVLFANSSIRPSDHRQAYANGRRTAAEAFEQGRQ